MLVPSPNHARRRLLHFRVLLVRILMDGWVGTWDIDFPKSDADWTPFLDTQIRIDRNGKLHTKFYRKKKHITLNVRSHHPMRTKIEVTRNFYKSARESYKIVDNLLCCNGYSKTRDIMKIHIKGISGPSMESSTSQSRSQIRSLSSSKTVDFLYVLF